MVVGPSRAGLSTLRRAREPSEGGWRGHVGIGRIHDLGRIGLRRRRGGNMLDILVVAVGPDTGGARGRLSGLSGRPSWPALSRPAFRARTLKDVFVRRTGSRPNIGALAAAGVPPDFDEVAGTWIDEALAGERPVVARRRVERLTLVAAGPED